MRRMAIILALMCCVGAGSCQSSRARAEARRYWRKVVTPQYHTDYLTIKVDVVRDADSSNTYSFIIAKRGDTVMYLNRDWQIYFLFTPDRVLSVNTLDRELMEGTKDCTYYDVMYDQYPDGEVEYFHSLVFYKERETMDFTGMRDTLVDGLPYKVIYRDMKNGFFFNPNSQKYDIPDFYTVRYLFNPRTGTVDQVMAHPLQVSGNEAWPMHYTLHYGIDASGMADSIFDFSSPFYRGYSRHDDTFIPYSWSFYSDSGARDSLLTDTVMRYPIVNPEGDTTTLADARGWLLLDFWFFQCRGCREQFRRWQQERDTLGQTRIERAGVRIMPINATSDNVEELRAVARHYRMGSQIYHSKGIGNVLDMHIMPQYYLISPDKKILLKTNTIGDGGRIIEKIHSYETQVRP